MTKSLLTILLLLIAGGGGGQVCLAQTTNPIIPFNCFDPAPASSPGGARPPTTVPMPDPEPTGGLPACSRVLNVNIHYILRADGSGNFSEVSDQTPYTIWSDRVGIPPYVVRPADPSRNGYEWAKGIVADMNTLWAANPPQWNNYAQVPRPAKKIRVVLNGVYFHRVSASEYFVDNNPNSPTFWAGVFIPGTGIPDPTLFNRYGVAKDSVINLIMAPDYDRPETQLGGVARGFGFNPTTPQGNWVKVFNGFACYRWRRENDGNPNVIQGYTVPDNSRITTANTFCHELGHLFNLVHPFDGGNGCTDLNTNFGRCNGGNLMSYCDATGNALSPCQLATAHSTIINPTRPGTNDYSPYLSRTQSACEAVPPRAFFSLSSCLGNPRTVLMNTRGTFNASDAVVNVYDAGMNLLASSTSNGPPSNDWDIGQLLTLAPATDYWVELVANAGRAGSHRSRQPMRVNTLPDRCRAITYTPQ